MKDKQKLLDKANSILLLIKEFEDFSNEINSDEIISETELLFFAYDKKYPALADLANLKQRIFDNISTGIDIPAIKYVKPHILRFIEFVNDYE